MQPSSLSSLPLHTESEGEREGEREEEREERRERERERERARERERERQKERETKKPLAGEPDSAESSKDNFLIFGDILR